MIEKFNNIYYLLIYIIHFVGIAIYSYQTIVGTRKFCEKFEIDETAFTMIRFVGAFMLGWVLMAIYVMFFRRNGVVGAGSFFNLVFVQNLMYLIFGIYTIYINKLGHTEKTNSEGVIAAGVLTILSAILTYGLADKIYI